MKRRSVIMALLVLIALSGAAQATLIDRGGGLIYDDVLKITWLQNANLADTNAFGVSAVNTNGSFETWDQAMAWIAAMNVANYLGYSDWRLPVTAPVNGGAFNYEWSYAGDTDYAYNIGAPGTIYASFTGNELAYMFFNNLANKADYSPSGAYQPDGGLTKTGPFQNLKPEFYWTGTVSEYTPGDPDHWLFDMDSGHQSWGGEDYFAWPVRPGDVATTTAPEPTTMLLLSLGLMGLAGVRRKSQK